MFSVRGAFLNWLGIAKHSFETRKMTRPNFTQIQLHLQERNEPKETFAMVCKLMELEYGIAPHLFSTVEELFAHLEGTPKPNFTHLQFYMIALDATPADYGRMRQIMQKVFKLPQGTFQELMEQNLKNYTYLQLFLMEGGSTFGTTPENFGMLLKSINESFKLGDPAVSLSLLKERHGL